MKISNHFQESSQRLSSHLKNQEHYTKVTRLEPIKHQSEWINLTYRDRSLKTSNFQQQKKLSEPCEAYKQSYNAKPKSSLKCQPKTTIGLTKMKMSEIKTKKPEEFSSIWKPLHNNWDVTTSGNDASNDKSKELLPDDTKDGDSILIVDPG